MIEYKGFEMRLIAGAERGADHDMWEVKEPGSRFTFGWFRNIVDAREAVSLAVRRRRMIERNREKAIREAQGYTA